ncbi:hypothetical protein C8Q76DRAFT_769774 [Earliella scabrosa]|nr:hypothetical protein C8Q76DRAFT_769774 [Earliella scabrosa]
MAHWPAACAGEVGAFDGLVAAPGFSATSVFTSPNATWVPRFAIAHSDITTYTDGRWGRHEYSRWPQEFTRESFHIHCIPLPPTHIAASHTSLGHSRTSRPDAPGDVLWQTLEVTDWQVAECGMPGVGTLNPTLELELVQEVSKVVARFRTCEKHDGWSNIGSFLVVCVQHALDRMRTLPAIPGAIIGLAAHVQRLVLELWGMVNWIEDVLPRVQTKQDCRTHVLEILGAHTPDASVAQMLHFAGVPVWFQQPITDRLAVYKVVQLTDLPSDFSTTPSFPRMLLAKRDLSGALNMPGEWRRAMTAIVRRQLCPSRLPALLSEDDCGEEPPAKRPREGPLFVSEDSSSAGPAPPIIVLQNPAEVKTLGHSLTPQPRPPASGLGTTARRKKVAEQASAGCSKAHPARVFYHSVSLNASVAWRKALQNASPLPEPATSWLSIRTFCRLRLFDATVCGRPLTILEWRDSLWGDYKIDQPTGAGRQKLRREQQLSIRRLLGKLNALPSYRADISVRFGRTIITHDVLASDGHICARVAWDVYETNWRCELLALDALMVESNGWTEFDRLMRESNVAKVWGGTSGLDIVPNEDNIPMSCWLAPPEDGWKQCAKYLQAFVNVLQRWPGCPDSLRFIHAVPLDDVGYTDVLQIAVGFYVSTFVAKYHRLPVPPMNFPVSLAASSTIVRM